MASVESSALATRNDRQSRTSLLAPAARPFRFAALAALDVAVCLTCFLVEIGPFGVRFGVRLGLGFVAWLVWRGSASAEELKDEPRTAGVAVSILVAALPVVGAMLVALTLGQTGKGRAKVTSARHLAWPLPVRWEHASFKARVPLPAEAPAALEARLANTATPTEVRLHALMRAKDLSIRVQTRLASQALSDPQDEVRLLAFSLVDRLRATHEGLIEAARTDLKKAAAPAAKGGAHLHLAETLWEAVYVGLYEDSAQRDACREALSHLEAARQLGPLPAAALLLRGRILLLQGDDAQAALALSEAQTLGSPPSKVLPYLAECAFRRRAFGELLEHLAQIRKIDEEATFLPASFGPVLEHWL